MITEEEALLLYLYIDIGICACMCIKECLYPLQHSNEVQQPPIATVLLATAALHRYICMYRETSDLLHSSYQFE